MSRPTLPPVPRRLRVALPFIDGLMSSTLVLPGTPAAMHLRRAEMEMNRTAHRAREMARDSATTIAVRLAMLARTNGHPLALAHPEFELMGREKVQAFTASAVAVAAGLQDFNEVWWRWRAHQIDAMGQFTASVMSSINPAELLVAETRLMRLSARAAAGAFSRFTRVASRIAGLGLAPIHAVAAANARRLTADRPAG